ncbi:PREDICTED: uncharacterized protein LOC107334550 [Acropora digitifera]|uniref:uncharacterized protein LOC107334550 n=1 Tax=Acropora digitifera TaxID=70779 RepID=UPI00077AE090|nr:PREDICTED: uncharacterized protein LOC107334550 [Acropora digitifera]
MTRSVKDLRELINVSRLSFRDDEEVDERSSDSALVFGGIPLEVSQPTLLKRSTKDLTPLCAKGKCVSRLKSSGSSGRDSLLPPIGTIQSFSTSSPCSSAKNSPEVGHPTRNEGRVTSARSKDLKLLKANFDNILLHMDSTVVGVWLKRANDSIKILTSWLYDGDNFVRFAHFWLSEMPTSKQKQLIDMEFSIFIDELKFSFGAGLKGGSVSLADINNFAHAILWEYPEKFNSSEFSDYFLSILLCLCSGRKNNYRALLSDVQCSTLMKQFVQLILATRAFAVVNICTGVLEFYKGAFPSHSYIQSTCDSFACKSLVSLATDFAFQAVKKEFPDVLDFLIQGYTLQYQSLKDGDGKSLIFTAVLSGKGIMLEHLLKKSRVDVNEKAPSGNTALHAAVNTGNISMVQTLINAGAKVNACNAECEGATPLHLAVMAG